MEYRKQIILVLEIQSTEKGEKKLLIEHYNIT